MPQAPLADCPVELPLHFASPAHPKHPETQTRLKRVSAPYTLCENEAHIKHHAYAQESRPHARSPPPPANGNKRKTALPRKRNCRPRALEATNPNAAASNLLRTCSKTQSPPNSVIPYIRTILRATSMMITDTDNDQLNY